MIRTTWSVLIVALLLLAPVFGLFAGGQAEEEAVDEEVLLEIYYPVAVDAPVTDILEEYAREFEMEYPNVTVDPIFSGGYDDAYAALQTTIEGGATPPALSVLLATDLYDLVNSGYVTALDDHLAAFGDSDEYLDDFLPAYLENSWFMDQLWSIPFQRSAVVLYYNADLLAEHGHDAPESWQELGEVAADLTERENGEVTRWGLEFPSGWPYWLFQPLAIGAGQNIVGEDSLSVTFDDPAVVEAIDFYLALSEEYQAMPEGIQGSWGAAPSNFAAGDTAMIVHSSGSLTGILQDADFEVGVMPLPGKEPGTFASVPGGGNFYMSEGLSAAQEEAAIQFIRFITEPERVAEFSTQTGYIPHRHSAFETDVYQEYADEVPQALDARDALAHAEAELSLQNLGEVRSIFHDYLHQAISGEMSPADAMSAAQQAAEDSLEAFR